MNNLYILLGGIGGVCLLTVSCYASYRKEQIKQEYLQKKIRGLNTKVEI